MTRLGVTLVPAGVIPRDPNLKVRLTPLPAAPVPQAAPEAAAPAIPSLTVTPASVIGIGDVVEMTVTVSVAPTSDLVVAVGSVNVDVATADVDTVTIRAGTKTATFNITGVANGGTVATAYAQGYVSHLAAITVETTTCTPFLTANFDGTGDLSTYTPELNTLVVPGTPPDGPGNEDTFADNPGLDKFVLDGTGAVQLDITAGIAQDAVISLAPGTPPESADYAIDVEFQLPAFADAPLYNLYCSLAGRQVETPGNEPFHDEVVAGFTVSYSPTTETIVLTPQLQIEGSISDAEWIDGNNEYANVDLGTDAQSLTLRAEFVGRTAKLFVNGVAQSTNAYDPDTGDPAGTTTAVRWTGAQLDPAGTVAFGVQFQNDPEDATLTLAKVATLTACVFS